jgi:phosphopantetheine adenylyltransferase
MINIISAALSIFNDRIVIIIDHSKEKRLYIIPILHAKLQVSSNSFKFTPLDKLQNIELATVKFVKRGKINKKIAKNESIDSITRIIRQVSNLEIEKNEREFMKRFVFVELGGVNISKFFYQIGWSLSEKIYVKDLQKVLSIYGENVKLEFTDDNLVVEQRHSDQIVLDQVDLIKRS